MLDERIGELLVQMERYSAEHEGIHAVPREEGRFLHMLVRLAQPRRVLELGTSSGYSTIWLATAARRWGARVETVEFDPAKIELARSNFERAGLEGIITVHQADANRFLAELQGPLDFVFMDTEKEEYLSQFRALWPNVERGGVVAADNAVDLAANMRDFLGHVKALEGALSVTVPIGNGLELTYRL